MRRGSGRHDKVSQGQGGIHEYHRLVPTSVVSLATQHDKGMDHPFFFGQAPCSSKSGTIVVPSTPYKKHMKTWRTCYMVRGSVKTEGTDETFIAPTHPGSLQTTLCYQLRGAPGLDWIPSDVRSTILV